MIRSKWSVIVMMVTGLAQKILDKGYKQVYPLKGGWREWYRSQYPVEEK